MDSARQLITAADKIRSEEAKITQAEWCRRAGFDEFGKLISNTYRRGNCKLSVFIQLLKPLGSELMIVKKLPELEIVYLKPEDLRPYEKNTRRHTPTDIEQIKTSILRCGFDDPIGIWGPENIVVEGHGRLIAAKELHLDQVPCIRLDHMTDAQRREYGIRHNRTQELSAWDFDKLDEEIAALMIAGADLSDLGFAIKSTENVEQSFVDAEEKVHKCPRCGHEWMDGDVS